MLTSNMCRCLFLSVAGYMATMFAPVFAATTWTGAGDDDWFNPANWDSGVPGAGSDAVINSGSVLLTNSTDALHSLTMGGGMLTFSNWNTQLSALNITIQSGATLTHVTNSATTTNGLGEWAPDGRVWIVCTNFDLRSGGKIDAKGRGFMGSTAIGSSGYGPGRGICSGANYASGASHGGRGGLDWQLNFIRSDMYGLINAPVQPGSGGGGQLASTGGGAIRIDAGTGSVVINGVVNASANDSMSNGSGGSGGSLFITCQTFAGTTNGLLEARGGYNKWAPSTTGGGGRIAVVYDTAVQSAQNKPYVRFNLASGVWNTTIGKGEDGTLYLSDESILTTNLLNFENVRLYGVTNWSIDSLSLTNQNTDKVFVFSESQFILTVTNTLQINAATYKLGSEITGSKYTELNCGALLLTNGGRLYLFSQTNAVTTDYGTRLTVSKDIVIATNCWLYPVSDGTNGGTVYISADNVTINAGGGINANGLGYDGAHSRNGYKGLGPGGAVAPVGNNYGGGGGYGGKGGTGSASGGTGGIINAWTNAPLNLGSGGGGANRQIGGAGADWADGGGLVWIRASRKFVLEGAIEANGQNGQTWSGGGSGGAIFIITRVFQGNGSLSAYGGNGGYVNTSAYGGGGGGGRIALWHRVSEANQRKILDDPDNAQNNVPRFFSTNDLSFSGFSGTWSVNNGAGYAANADPGTAIYITAPPPEGTVFFAE